MPVDGLLRSTSAAFYPSMLFAKTQRRKKAEVLIETFIRKQLRLKAHTVTKVEETDESHGGLHRPARAADCCAAGSAGSDAGRFMTSAESGSGAICRCGSCP